MAITGHGVWMFRCGKHIKVQCRCTENHGKPTVLAEACPVCPTESEQRAPEQDEATKAAIPDDELVVTMEAHVREVERAEAAESRESALRAEVALLKAEAEPDLKRLNAGIMLIQERDALRAEVERKDKALREVKVRISYAGMPQEQRREDGAPDWRHTIRTIEAALADPQEVRHSAYCDSLKGKPCDCNARFGLVPVNAPLTAAELDGNFPSAADPRESASAPCPVCNGTRRMDSGDYARECVYCIVAPSREDQGKEPRTIHVQHATWESCTPWCWLYYPPGTEPAPSAPKATPEPETSDTILDCHICGKPGTCFGTYEDPEGPVLVACDECCGHGNEDGWCEPLNKRKEALSGSGSPPAETP